MMAHGYGLNARRQLGQAGKQSQLSASTCDDPLAVAHIIGTSPIDNLPAVLVARSALQMDCCISTPPRSAADIEEAQAYQRGRIPRGGGAGSAGELANGKLRDG
jgi:hypothetical protein